MAQFKGRLHAIPGSDDPCPSYQDDDKRGCRRMSTISCPSLSDPDEGKLFTSRAAKDDWCSNMGSQNLASILNDPSVSRSHVESFFTKDWGSSFVDCPVDVDPVSVTRKELEFMRHFLKSVRRRGKTLQRVAFMMHSTAVSQRLNVSEENLGKVPQLFLRSDFDLSNVETFNAVLAFNACHPTTTSPSTEDTTSSSSLSSDFVGNSQKNLADILDLVEDHLSHQIAVRFRDFFHIMNAMDVLMEQVSRTIKEVTSVRAKCDLLKKSLILPSLQIILLTRTRKNRQILLDKLTMMESLYQCNSNVNSLLSSKDYVSALSLISTCRSDMEKHLPGVKCFQNLSFELSERERLIEKFLEEDLNKLLTAQFLRPFYPESDKTTSSSRDREGDDDEALFNILFGMVRIRKFSFVEEFREEACAAVITVVKQTIIQALSKEDMEVNHRQENHLYEQLKDLEVMKWINILSETFGNLTLLLKRISHVNQIIRKTLHTSSGKEFKENLENSIISLNVQKTLTEEDFVEWTKCASDSMSQLCDFAQSRCSLLIERRISDSGHDRMTTTEFLKFAKLVQDFYDTCQGMSPSMASPSGQNLKSVLHNQANRFASRYHEEKRKKMNSLLDIEQWKSMESVPRDFQTLLDQLIAEKDQIMKNGSLPHDNTVKGLSSVSVSGEKFVIVNSVVLLVTLVSEYLSTASLVGIIAYDLLSRLVDLLKHFNTRTYKLVYLGLAKQTSGLKSVTSRTLINSARSLQLILKLIPRITKTVPSLITDCQQQQDLFRSFEDVSTLLIEHVSKIHDKVINQSRDFISAKMSKWEAKPPVPSPQFISVTQHLGVLNENLEECLPTDQLSMLFSKIDEAFKDILREQLRRLNIVNDGGPQHGLVTQELVCYTQTMNKKVARLNFKFSHEDVWSR